MGTLRDLDEVRAFAAEGKVSAEITGALLENINDIFCRMKSGGSDGWMMLDFESLATLIKINRSPAPPAIVDDVKNAQEAVERTRVSRNIVM